MAAYYSTFPNQQYRIPLAAHPDNMSVPQDIYPDQRPRQGSSHSFHGPPSQPMYATPPQNAQVNGIRAEAGVGPVVPQGYPMSAPQPSYMPPRAASYHPVAPPDPSYAYGYGTSPPGPYPRPQPSYQPHQYPENTYETAYEHPTTHRRSGSYHSQDSHGSRPGTGRRRSHSHRSRHSDDEPAGRFSDDEDSGHRQLGYSEDEYERQARRRDREELDRQRRKDEASRRPTLSDSVLLVYDTLKGAISGKRE